MKISAKTFAQNLKKSSLKKEDQEVILDLCSKLTDDQIAEISKTLEEDVYESKQIYDKAEIKKDIMMNNFLAKLKELKSKFFQSKKKKN